MPKAAVQSTSPIIRAPAPRPLTTWIEHLKRRKIAGRKARSAVKRQRAVTKQRLAAAEHLIADVIASGDVIAQGTQGNRWGNDEPVVFVMLTLHSALFNNLAIFGSELEDTEDTHDAERTEADEGEHDLGRTERIQQPEEYGCDDAEPSLGSTAIVDQRRWHEGAQRDRDLEQDKADQEPSLGALEWRLCGELSTLGSRAAAGSGSCRLMRPKSAPTGNGAQPCRRWPKRERQPRWA
jgi:hypothetical protein